MRQRTNQGNALLLSERYHADPLVAFLADFQAVKPLVDLVVGGEIRQSVLDLHIFQRREFGEEAKFLKQAADVPLAQLRPVLRREIGRFSVVEEQFAREIVAIADEIAAKRALSASTGYFLPFSSVKSCRQTSDCKSGWAANTCGTIFLSLIVFIFYDSTR